MNAQQIIIHGTPFLSMILLCGTMGDIWCTILIMLTPYSDVELIY